MSHFKRIVLIGFIIGLLWITYRLNNVQQKFQESRPFPDESRRWISMSVCWSSNTKLHGKEHFPYLHALKLSTQLWRMKTSHKVLVALVYEEKFQDRQGLVDYANEIEQLGAVVKMVSANQWNCALVAQLQRMFAFAFADIIRPNDIVITSDVDAFVVDDHIFDNLEDKFDIWVYQDTPNQVAMCFIAMNASLWSKVVGLTSVEDLLITEGLKQGTTLTLSHWSIDQSFITRKLTPYCGLYNKTTPTSVCFRGHFSNCYSTKSHHVRIENCKWWHFYKDCTEQVLNERFNTIRGGKSM